MYNKRVVKRSFESIENTKHNKRGCVRTAACGTWCFIGCLGVVLHKPTELNRRDPLCGVWPATGSEENGKLLPRLLVSVPFPPTPSHLVSIPTYIIIMFVVYISAMAAGGRWNSHHNHILCIETHFLCDSRALNRTGRQQQLKSRQLPRTVLLYYGKWTNYTVYYIIVKIVK